MFGTQGIHSQYKRYVDKSMKQVVAHGTLEFKKNTSIETTYTHAHAHTQTILIIWNLVYKDEGEIKLLYTLTGLINWAIYFREQSGNTEQTWESVNPRNVAR